MPKKGNAFMEFASEWKGKYGKHMTMPEVVAVTGDIWKGMNTSERAPYLEKAKSLRFGHKVQKFTCTGTPIEIVQKQQKEIEQRENQIKLEINQMINQGVKKNTLKNLKFYFIMVNWFSKSLDGKVYVPAEISLSEFSLQDGVTNVYHQYVNPGDLSIGDSFEAKKHSEATHKLPLPRNAFGEKNLGKIYNDILKFVNNKEVYYPVYTKVECIPIVEAVFDFLKADRNANSTQLNVYPIQFLFYSLKMATCKIGELDPPQSVFITNDYFSKDPFEYQVNIACDFHEKEDRANYCTLSCVKRWGFSFAEYMCVDMAIKLIPGRHIPLETDLETAELPNSNNKSVWQDNQEVPCCSKSMRQETDDSYSSKTSVSMKFSDILKEDKNIDKLAKKISELNTKSDEEDETTLNPWAMRSKKRNIPQMPDQSAFKLDCSLSDAYGDLSNAEDYSSNTSYYRGRGKIPSLRLGQARGRAMNPFKE